MQIGIDVYRWISLYEVYIASEAQCCSHLPGLHWQQFLLFLSPWLSGDVMVMDQSTSKVTILPELLRSTPVLEITILVLLVFLTISVAYLSFVDWKDKRRRDE